jgi:8-oxo-dGTP pyrophosphatase MutT (NUDIX family)
VEVRYQCSNQLGKQQGGFMITTPLVRELMDIAMLPICPTNTRAKLIARIRDGKLTRIQNKQNHLCVYFVPVKWEDNQFKILIGLHKKANLYLAPGGHLEVSNKDHREERCIEALKREFSEEFHTQLPTDFSPNPFWVTMTHVKNRECKVHFDIWYAIDVNGMNLVDNAEFDHMLWLTFSECRNHITDPASIEALNVLEKNVQAMVTRF